MKIDWQGISISNKFREFLEDSEIKSCCEICENYDNKMKLYISPDCYEKSKMFYIIEVCSEFQIKEEL